MASNSNKNTAQALGKQLEGMMRSKAEAFVKGNAVAVQKLGESVVRAIFAQSFEATLPGIPDVGEHTDLEIRAAVEEVLAVRDEAFQLVAQAEKENAELVAQVRANAVNFVAKMTSGALGILTGFASKAIL